MDPDSIRLLCDYNRWVNQLLLGQCEKLPPERTREALGMSFITVHDTLAHILGVEVI